MNLVFDMIVVGSDGVEVGTLDRVLVDPARRLDRKLGHGQALARQATSKEPTTTTTNNCLKTGQ